ncbi:MAG: formate dehydrogenase accessory protein FdhE [Pirellulaceae bacterium]
MVSRQQRAIDDSWICRARDLAALFPAASEVLTFYANLAEFQNELVPRVTDFDALPELASEVAEFTGRFGTDLLCQQAESLTPDLLAQAIDNYWHNRDVASPASFFARVVLQPWAICSDLQSDDHADNHCLRCGHLPQVAVLQPQGHGNALSLVCSLCLFEWEFPRLRCPGCLEQDSRKQEFFAADSIKGVQVNVCRGCNMYIHCVDKSRDPAAIPFVDELSALPLDMWARENGLQKLQPNLAGL